MSEDAVNVHVTEDVAVTDNPDIGNSVSWDDLENLTESNTVEEAFKDAKQEEAKNTESQDQPPLEPTSDKEEIEEEGEKTEEIAEDEAEIAEYKTIKAALAGEEISVEAEAIFTQKIDGEEVDVSLQDLLNNYSGKVAYDKRFQELSTEKQEFQNNKVNQDKEIESITKYINNFADKMKDNDALGAMTYLAEFAGMKPHDFKRQLIEQVIPEVKRISSMSREEYELEVITAENEYLRQQHESVEQEKSQQQANVELHKRINDLQEAHGLQDEEFRDGLRSLKNSNYEGEVTPETVAEYCVQVKAFRTADDVIKQVDPTLSGIEEVRLDMQQLVLDNPNMSDKYYSDILKEAIDTVKSQAEKSVSKKVRRNTKKQPKNQRIDKEYENNLSFEDL